MEKTITGYDVGALLYCPANAHGSLVEALKNEQFGKPFSLAFCLEDTVREEAVLEAEEQLRQTLRAIQGARGQRDFYLPMIFVRIRTPEQLAKLGREFGAFRDILTGFILPKFFIENCDAYIRVIQDLRGLCRLDYYYMPIFESPTMIDLRARHENLTLVKDKLEAIADRVLNIRVGGNDFSHVFGLRRRVTDTIYDIKPVADLLIDIVTTFAARYVVSGPVWEYYAGAGWEEGMRKELDLDLLSGFVGKTVIHPNQIPVVNAMLQVSPTDYDDALSILGWDPLDGTLVTGSTDATRMNEYRTHHHWARRILRLGEVYGIRDQ